MTEAPAFFQHRRTNCTGNMPARQEEGVAESICANSTSRYLWRSQNPLKVKGK